MDNKSAIAFAEYNIKKIDEKIKELRQEIKVQQKGRKKFSKILETIKNYNENVKFEFWDSDYFPNRLIIMENINGNTIEHIF